MGWIKSIGFGLLVFFAILFGILLYFQNAVFFFDGTDHGFLLAKPSAVLDGVYLPAFYVHVSTGSLVLMLGVFQLSTSLRNRFRSWHRRAGRVYVYTVLALSAPSGFIMALFANGGWPAGAGFLLLSLAWWFFTWKGLYKALAHDWDGHRRYMIRSYALTFAAVTLRMYSFFFALAGYRGVAIYILIAWLSWITTLCVAEVFLSRTGKAVMR